MTEIRLSAADAGRLQSEFRWILGIRFYTGTFAGLLEKCCKGGLIVVPAAPALVDLRTDRAYREALEGSDIAITDSGFLVLLWTLFKGERLERISGLKLLRGLLTLPSFREPSATFWVMPSQADTQSGTAWLKCQGITVIEGDCYVAPIYPAGELEDRALWDSVEARHPAFVIINLGGGVQERLGLYLRRRLSYRPAIICTGAAIAFLSGRQANIPPWADRLMLGWLLRCFHDPRKFIPRYWKSLRLVALVWKHGANSVAATRPSAKS
jgi:UDP-N-acetyl-D-mannosaminuronic acid transferase (WecB/TagA/CpsF family)